MENSYYLGVDPGRSKTCLALVTAAGKIYKLKIADTRKIKEELKLFLDGVTPEKIVLGDGTNSASIEEAVRLVVPQQPLFVINEAYSTEEARDLYWRCNPPKGWRKLFPLGLLVPPVPLDDYAAVVLVRRFLEEKNE